MPTANAVASGQLSPNEGLAESNNRPKRPPEFLGLTRNSKPDSVKRVRLLSAMKTNSLDCSIFGFFLELLQRRTVSHYI